MRRKLGIALMCFGIAVTAFFAGGFLLPPTPTEVTTLTPDSLSGYITKLEADGYAWEFSYDTRWRVIGEYEAKAYLDRDGRELKFKGRGTTLAGAITKLQEMMSLEGCKLCATTLKAVPNAK